MGNTKETGFLPPRDPDERPVVSFQNKQLLIDINGSRHEISLADALSLASNIIIQVEMAARFTDE